MMPVATGEPPRVSPRQGCFGSLAFLKSSDCPDLPGWACVKPPVRREALVDRVEVKDLHRCSCRSRTA